MSLTFETVGGAALPEKDIRALGDLHRRILPGSDVSKLGNGGAECFYRFAAASREETLYLTRQDGVPRACAVVTWAPTTMRRRFALALLRHPVLTSRAAAGTLRQPAKGAGEDKGALAKAPERTVAEAELAPELSLIFTDASLQGKGVGRRLLEMIEESLRKAGAAAYFARTNAESGNPAIAFYDRSGFERLGHVRGKGKVLLALRKAL